MSTLERQPCSPGALTGMWDPIESEIPEFDLSSENYQFTSDDQFMWHHPGQTNVSNAFKFIYDLNGFTLNYGRRGSQQFSILAWFEEDVLVFQPAHGYKTRSRKRATSE
jgi:hypothetical protein